jgi:serine/threonine protein kinase
MTELKTYHGYEGKVLLNLHDPDVLVVGYQVIRELGRNSEAGRTTYLAIQLISQQKVVIKEFSFARMVHDWSDFRPCDREMQILRKLEHPRIPRYIGFAETSEFFFLILEYKTALPLSLKQSFQPEQIKQIALSTLEILVNLQQQISPIIHRDVKPDNILVDQQLNAYLIDFGLARQKDEKVHLSTFVAGTPGFIPPEEYLGSSLTEASDLYSLGVTVICLFTHTQPRDVSSLIDHNYRFNFQNLVPQINAQFRSWLIKMVEPRRNRRYPNASAAMNALESIRL